LPRKKALIADETNPANLAGVPHKRATSASSSQRFGGAFTILEVYRKGVSALDQMLLVARERPANRALDLQVGAFASCSLPVQTALG
jgi:hypothetical protein